MSREALDDLADEYVLGLMEGPGLAAFEARLAGDEGLRAAVARSRARFLELDLAAPALPLDEALWARVARLRAGGEPAAAATMPSPAAANLPGPPRRLRRLLAAAGGLGLLLLGVYLGAETLRPEAVVLTVLVDAAGTPLAVVEDFGRTQVVLRFVGDFDVPEGRQMQIWTLPTAEAGPVSIGLLRGAVRHALTGPDRPDPADGQLYEITLEDPGGSPSGRPSGPVVAKGFAAAQDL